MAVFAQKNVPKENPKYPFLVNRFNGGINNVNVPELLLDNQCTDVYNMDISAEGVLDRRLGLNTLGEIVLTEGMYVMHLDVYQPINQAPMLMVGYNTGQIEIHPLYLNNDGRWTNVAPAPSGQTLITFTPDIVGTSFYSGFSHNGNYYFLTSFGYFEYHATDNVLYKMTFPASNWTPTTGAEAHTDIYNAGMYKDKCYYPSEQDFKSAYKGANVMFSGTKYQIIQHQNRFYIAGIPGDPHTLYISDITNPYYFPAGLGISLPPNGDIVKGLAIYQSSLIIFREHDVYVLTGNSNLPDVGESEKFTLKKLNTHTGCKYPQTIKMVNGFLFYLGSDNVVYKLTSSKNSGDMPLAQIVSNTINLLNPRFNFLTECKSRSPRAVYHNNKYYLYYGLSNCLIYDYNFMAWTRHQYSTQNYYIARWDDMLFVGGKAVDSTNPAIRAYGYNDDELYLDDDAPYYSYFTTKRFHMAQPSTFKQFRDLYFVSHVYDDMNTSFCVNVEIDNIYLDNAFTNQSQISRWGATTFGSKFIDKNINSSLPINIGRRGRNISFMISSGLQYKTKLATLTDLPAIGTSGATTGVYYYVISEKAVYQLQYNLVNGSYAHEWVKIDAGVYNTPFRIYEINGTFELRGNR